MCTNAKTKEHRPLIRPTQQNAFGRHYYRPMFNRKGSNLDEKRKFSLNTMQCLKIVVISSIGTMMFLTIVAVTAIGTIYLTANIETVGLRGQSNNNNEYNGNYDNSYNDYATHLQSTDDYFLDTTTLTHPYTTLWPSYSLPSWATKSPPSTLYPPPYSIPASKQTCLVHVGKTAGSTIGCQLGFNLHCHTNQSIAPGLLPRYTTHMFHTNIYDCPSSTPYYLFVVRNPLTRIQSAFAYDKPKDWDWFRSNMGEKYYWLRKRLYDDCDFDTLEDMAVRGLRNETYGEKSRASPECRRRAEASLLGTEHFGCHFYYNYQYHLEGITKNATLLTIRTEHIIKDWNTVELELGGGQNVMGSPEEGVMEKNNVNSADSEKFLSDESRMVICRLLCNDIQVYKEILHRSVNLNEEQVALSIRELRESCPIEADATMCDTPKPDITQKLLQDRGYEGQTDIAVSPYEKHWQGRWVLPHAMKKDHTKYLRKTSPDKEVCFVRVGSTADATVGCALGFNQAECSKDVDVAPGLLSQYSTKQFYCGMYDCFDDSGYYMFVVRDPLRRFVEAFEHDLPKDWEEFRKTEGETKYNRHKELFMDCQFDSLEKFIKGLSGGDDSADGISKECRQRARSAIDGTGQYGTQMYYNYQYYAEGLPKDAEVLVIREEYLVEDWNSAESTVGGVRSILGSDQTTLDLDEGGSTADLSDASRQLLCEKLCNEIQVYKTILTVAANLSPEQREQSLKDLKASCPKEAASDSCELALPDITTKLYLSRGYDEGMRLDPPTGDVSIGRSINPESPSSPYEQIWPGLKLPKYMKKDPEFAVESVPKDKRTCLVHVGKTAGSTVGCAIGFNLHCSNHKIIAPGLFPQYATNMLHAQMYDCHDDSAYFVFVVRNPLDRMVSAFNYDNPSKDWQKFRAEFGEKHYNFRKKLYMDCPFTTFDELAQLGLSSHGNATEECRQRAAASIDGTEHFGCHFFFNYQYHLEAVPEGATIMTIRTEHLIEDWNTVEYNLGGEQEVLGSNQTVLAHNNVNTRSDDKLKHLSDESRSLICEKLCNEVQMYKKILRLSINLNEEQVQESIDEMMESCPKEAAAERCAEPLPDITDKLVNSRGYLKK